MPTALRIREALPAVFYIKNDNIPVLESATNNHLDKNISSHLYKKANLKRKHPKKISPYLSIETIQKILHRFLIEKKISKEELAKALKITINNLESLFCKQSLYLIPKVNLPLIRLYCETKFETKKRRQSFTT